MRLAYGNPGKWRKVRGKKERGGQKRVEKVVMKEETLENSRTDRKLQTDMRERERERERERGGGDGGVQLDSRDDES